MDKRKLIVPAAAAVVLIVVTSYVQGVWTERWRPRTSEQLQAFSEAFAKVPITIGDWDGEASPETSEREREAAGAVGWLSRNYRNPKAGDQVSVYMICGASRAVAVHTPESCYPGAGFRLEGKPQKYSIQYSRAVKPAGDDKTGKPSALSESAEFTTAVFIKEEPTGTQRLRLFWAWNSDGLWESPDWPRMRFGGRQALNKLYLITPEPGSNQPVEDSPAIEFARLFLPMVDKLLFPESAESPQAAPEAAKAAEKAAE